MRTTSLQFLLGMLANAALLASAFTFTGPPTSEKLNLSAPAITISWALPETESPIYHFLDLRIRGRWPSGNSFSHGIVQNFPIALGAGSYGWEPKSVHDALILSNNTLSAGRDYDFEAHLHAEVSNSTSSPGMTMRSDKYQIEGVALIAGASPFRRPAVGLAGAVAAAVGAGMLLL